MSQTVEQSDTLCPNCEGDQFSWSLSTRVGSMAPMNGQLNAHDVAPILVEFCEDCSETIRVIEDDDTVNELMRRTVVVQVTKRQRAEADQVATWLREKRDRYGTHSDSPWYTIDGLLDDWNELNGP